MRLLLVLLLASFTASTASAQTLAHPGWAGSGMTNEAWWRTAVFYRVDVAHFQDSAATGTGDLHGLATRMDYIQSLGVDAVVLLPPFDETGFDDLLREGSGRRVRIVIGLEISTAATASDTARTLAAARQWLTRGAAGIYLERSSEARGLEAHSPEAASPARDPSQLLRDLRTLADSFPGQRVVLSAVPPASSPTLRLGRAATPELVDHQIVNGPGVLERELADSQNTPADTAPLLLTDPQIRSANAFFAQGPTEQLGRNKILAALLLTLRGAVSLRYGQELGLSDEAGGPAPERMQWTPSNLTPRPVVEAPPPPPVDPNVFGPYVPYVRPAPKPVAALPAPAGSPTATATPDPDTLRGFTIADVTPAPASVRPPRSNGKLANVALEDADPNSLLNYYRHLVQLHHGNTSIRNGAPHILDLGYDLTLAWVRSAPPGARTAANVVVVCNLSSKPQTLAIRNGLSRLGMTNAAQGGFLRPLLASWTGIPSPETTDRLVLPPYGVFIGELARTAR